MEKLTHIFTSESVSEGHPDKVCDQISDAILDAILMQDPESHVACETLATTDYLMVAGEITTNAKVDYESIARSVVERIGYDKPGLGFNSHDFRCQVLVHTQSPDINQGVVKSSNDSEEQGAGDQGLMFGFACDETPELMPAPVFYSHRIVERLAQLRHSGQAPFLRPDAKSQLSLIYDQELRPVGVKEIVVAHQHEPGAEKQVIELTRKVLQDVLPSAWLDNFDLAGENCHINGTGTFVIGGPAGDCGLTGRKIIVDTYGGMSRHGGGALSGKDPSKVDRSACYMARQAAKSIVAAGLARRCEIQVAYCIGISRPLSFLVNTFGTAKGTTDRELTELVSSGKFFDFRPGHIIENLGLKYPGKTWKYEDTASYGHFGREGFPWEKTIAL